MKSKRFVQTGCGALACVVAISGLPHPTGHHANRLHPRHPTVVGDITKTVMVTVSLGPSTTVTIGAGTMTNPLIDGSTSTTTSLFTTASPGVPSAIVSTTTLVTEIATTVFPSITPSPSSLFTSLSSDSITTASTTPTTILSSALPTTSSATSSTASPPVPTPTDSDFNPITAPAIGGGNSILAQNAADAQALNRKFRQLTFRDNCVDGDQACIGDSRAFCTLGTWRSDLCMQPNTKCRAVPRMQTNGTVLGCYTEADAQARFSSTGQPGNVFGE